MRREADDTGPLAELEHWRGLNAKYNSILEQIRAKDCRMAIQILHIAKSPVLQVSSVFMMTKCWNNTDNDNDGGDDDDDDDDEDDDDDDDDDGRI